MGSGCNRDTGLRPGFASNYYFFGCLVWFLTLKIINERQLSDKTGNQGPSPEKQEE